MATITTYLDKGVSQYDVNPLIKTKVWRFEAGTVTNGNTYDLLTDSNQRIVGGWLDIKTGEGAGDTITIADGTTTFVNAQTLNAIAVVAFSNCPAILAAANLSFTVSAAIGTAVFEVVVQYIDA